MLAFAGCDRDSLLLSLMTGRFHNRQLNMGTKFNPKKLLRTKTYQLFLIFFYMFLLQCFFRSDENKPLVIYKNIPCVVVDAFVSYKQQKVVNLKF